MRDITVYTAITGGRDMLRPDQAIDDRSFFIAFGDAEQKSQIWDSRQACTLFRSSRRNSRIHKILSHQYIHTEYSLWIDGCVALRVPPSTIIADWLQDSDLATFRHRTRACIYEEAQACLRLRLDTPEIIAEQMKSYMELGFYRRGELPECTVIARRASPKTERFNNAWWSEYCRYSVRDQLSFMRAVECVGITAKLITPTKFEHPYFDVLKRPPTPEHNSE